MDWRLECIGLGFKVHRTVKMPLPPCSPSQAGLHPPSAVLLKHLHRLFPVRTLMKATMDMGLGVYSGLCATGPDHPLTPQLLGAVSLPREKPVLPQVIPDL